MSEVALAVAAGARLFNRGRYFAAHERWEAAWRDASGSDRVLLESLVQLATGMHLRTARGGTRGAEHLLGRALIGLEEHGAAAYGIDVAHLIADVTAYLDWLRATRRAYRWYDRFRRPRIRLVSARP